MGDQFDCALDLMRRLPPQNVEENLGKLFDLVHPDLVDELLSSVDQPLKVKRCAKTGRDYLICDYNRDGDSYRSPWCNEYEPELLDGAVPSPSLRKIEIAANDAFDTYREMYYEGGVSSVYAFDMDDKFAIVVLIKKVSDGTRRMKGAWDSIHVFEVTERGRNAQYQLTSTVMLYMITNNQNLGNLNLSGSMTRQVEQDYPVDDPSAHIANVGRMVEDMELKMRNSLQDVYFGKTKDIVNDLRSLGSLAETVLSTLVTCATLAFAQSSSTLRTHSIAMPYIDEELQNRWFDFAGDAIVNTNQHIRLTSKKQSQSGFLWSRMPLASDNFEVEIEFKVEGTSGHLYGDGFAMWLTRQRMLPGPVFGSVDRFEGLGIFFDTYDNERSHRHSFPYVSAMFNDGTQTYDNDKDGSDTELAGCEADFRLRGIPTRAKFTYHKANFIQLDLQWKTEDEWDFCFKKHDITLPEHLYLGFSAHTGEVTDNHDIISVATRSIPPAIKEAAPRAQRVKKSGSSGGVMSVLFKLVLAGAFVGILFVGYRYYDQKNRMKRF